MTANQFNIQPVIKGDPLHKHRKFVIAILTLTKNVQAKINLGRRKHRFRSIHNCTGSPITNADELHHNDEFALIVKQKHDITTRTTTGWTTRPGSGPFPLLQMDMATVVLKT